MGDVTQTGHDYYTQGQGARPQPAEPNSLRRWWPAIGGFAFLVLGIVALIAWSSTRDDSGTSSGEVTSAVPMTAALTDINGGTATGTIAFELNNATGDICYQFATAQAAYPLSVSLLDMGAGSVLANLGTHNSGTMGCAEVGLTRTQAVLASPESHSAEVKLPDGVVLRGSLVYNPSTGGNLEVASPDAEGEPEIAAEPPPTGGTGKIGFILPDTESSDRWEDFDRPLIQAACDENGLECLIDNAEGDAANMSNIADQMIADGISVLVIANLDSESAAAIQQRAAEAGVKNIDYDRLTLGGSADVYVSFDNVAVGEAQGNGIIQCLGGDTQGARIIQLHGSPTDNNATLVAEGYNTAIADAGFEIVGEEAVPDWSNEQAAEVFTRLLDEAGGEIDGVLAANDGMGLAAQSVLAENGLTVPVTGQDATVDSLRAILQGSQCMSVYKPVSVEADAVVAAAAALIRGNAPPANATIDNGVTEIPFVQGQVTSIFREDVRIPVQDGFVSRDEICADIEDLCAQYGVGG